MTATQLAQHAAHAGAAAVGSHEALGCAPPGLSDPGAAGWEGSSLSLYLTYMSHI